MLSMDKELKQQDLATIEKSKAFPKILRPKRGENLEKIIDQFIGTQFRGQVKVNRKDARYL